MKRGYFILFVLSVLVFSACCQSWFSQTTKDTEKCKCKEFENYIKTWKTDETTGVIYIDRANKDDDSYLELQELFLKRLDCLKGKTIGYARKLFNGKPNEVHITIPKSRECLNCYLKRGDCEYIIFGKVHCYHLAIELGNNIDEKIITSTNDDLDVVTRQHYVWLYIK